MCEIQHMKKSIIIYIYSSTLLFCILYRYLTMLPNKKHAGLFQKKSHIARKEHVIAANKRRWQQYHISKSVDNVTHDHPHVNTYSYGDNVQCEGLDVQEEVLDAQSLPNKTIPIDKLRGVELQHIINQLIEGCNSCKLALNICNAKGVQPRCLGSWLFINCDNPACLKLNKISLGKQHQ